MMIHRAQRHRSLPTTNTQEGGFALIMTMFLLAVMAALLGMYVSLTRLELGTTRATRAAAKGFNVGEGGLNLRAAQVRSTFIGYNRPAGTSPSPDNPCVGTNMGSGDFRCQNQTIGNYSVSTYVVDTTPVNNNLKPIPPGDRFQGLMAQDYTYATTAKVFDRQNKVLAMLELQFITRLVPMFQFAAFYNKDLEILPGPSMTLSGPVHANGDLYLQSDNLLAISGQVTTAGALYRGRKNDSSCRSNSTTIMDPLTARHLVPSCSSRTRVLQNNVTAWNNMIQVGVPAVTVPAPEELDASPGKTYWDKADLRLVLRLNSSDVPQAIEVRTAANTNNTAATTALSACSGVLSGNLGSNRVVNTTNTLRNHREGRFIRMLDVDMRRLFDCLIASPSILDGKALSDNTEGGLVFYFAVSGPNSLSQSSNYGVRVLNGAQLRRTNGSGPLPIGLTIVSDGALYLQGDFNSVNKIPAAALVDSFNVLSNAWSDSNSTLALTSRTPTNTTHQLAILSGTDTTGNTEGSGGQGGGYNGGLENYPRFHENWNSAVTYTYRGSFVSLNRPRRVNGAWSFGAPVYTAPIRNWNYDTSFNAAQNLPPITPRFIYLKQQLFLRDFEQ